MRIGQLKELMMGVRLFCSTGAFVSLYELDEYLEKMAENRVTGREICLSFTVETEKEHVVKIVKAIADSFLSYHHKLL